MALCTRVETTEREVIIHIDGRMLLRVRPRYFRKHQLCEGAQFDAAAYTRAYGAYLYGHALDAAGRLLSVRARSEQEISAALVRYGYPQPVIARVMAMLCEKGLVDDGAFAQAWVDTRAAKSIGARRIAWELRAKGVHSDVVAQALADESAEDALAGAVRFVRKRLRAGGVPETPEARDKLIQALLRRGYSWDTARDALREAVCRATKS